jgi:hypothetical protein
VVSVSVIIRAQDNTTVTADDLANGQYASDTGQPTTTSAALGKITILFPNLNAGCSIGAEFVGSVTPSNYNGKITLRRDLLSKGVWRDDKPTDPIANTPNWVTGPRAILRARLSRRHLISSGLVDHHALQRPHPSNSTSKPIRLREIIRATGPRVHRPMAPAVLQPASI